MTQVIQQVGGDAESQNAYTGLPRQLTVDTTNREIRLHDGVTQGGHVIANITTSDARYQTKSPELTALSSLGVSNAKGLLIRRGPNNYAMRKLLGTSGQITVADSDGFANNPVIGLASVITSEHTWQGQQSFQGVVEFASGLNGNVSGDTFGTHTGNVVGNLVGDTQGEHTGSHVGNADFSNSQVIFADAQIPLTAIAGIGNAIGANAIPAGVITLWAGSAVNVPVGWAICDGTQGTPDLRNRFVRAAGTLSPGDTGGASTGQATIVVDSAGAHTHTLDADALTAVTGASLTKTIIRPEYEQNQVNVIGNVTLTDPGHAHDVTGTAESNGAHTHTATVGDVDTIPPFYSLHYIMKL